MAPLRSSAWRTSTSRKARIDLTPVPLSLRERGWGEENRSTEGRVVGGPSSLQRIPFRGYHLKAALGVHVAGATQSPDGGPMNRKALKKIMKSALVTGAGSVVE